MAKSFKFKTIIFITIFTQFNFTIFPEQSSELPDFLIKLNRFYGTDFKIVNNNRIQFIDGETLILDDGKNRTIEEKIERGDIEDQFFMPYPKGELKNPPNDKTHDPGRVRNTDFFKKLYGSTPAEIKTNLKELKWMPKYTDTVLLFNTKFGAWDSLKRVSDEFEKLDPELLKYVKVTAGTYNYRVIKDTDRLSAHSYGIAIDINVKYSSYWKWDKTYNYRNLIPYQIVKIFEDNGFIWGGKWYHYDTMHFEYRPELL